MPGAEEFAIHDFQGFGPLRFSEYQSLQAVSRLARGIAEHGPAFAHWAKLTDTDDSRLDQFEEAYEGHYPDLAEYGESVVDGFGLRQELEEATPELLASYVEIQVAAFARDMEVGGMILTSEGDGGVYVFTNL
jgi:antirestriction protein